jgi:hypothetical protein
MRLTALIAAAVSVFALGAALVGSATPGADGATSACGTSTAPPGFQVTLCITAPSPTVAGATPVSAAVGLTGAAPPVNGISYTLDGAYLVFDEQSPYLFTLHTFLFGTGRHVLSGQVAFSGGYLAEMVSMPLTFAPSSAPAPPPAFTPSTGTPAAPGRPVVVAAVGDGASGLTGEQRVADLIGSWQPNLFLYLGDVYQNGSPEDFLNWYGQNGSFFSRFRAITDPTVGNHEYTWSRAARAYFDYWGGIPPYYSYDVGGWHLVSLDNTAEGGQSPVTSPQYQWLAQDLAHTTSTCTLVYFHRPVYTVDADAAATEFAAYWKLFNAYHVTLALSGHAHNYQRWQPLDGNGTASPAGVTEIVAGTGGQWLSPFVATDPRLAAGFDNSTTTWGAVQLRLFPGSAGYLFQDIAGHVHDSGTVSCPAH